MERKSKRDKSEAPPVHSAPPKPARPVLNGDDNSGDSPPPVLPMKKKHAVVEPNEKPSNNMVALLFFYFIYPKICLFQLSIRFIRAK